MATPSVLLALLALLCLGTSMMASLVFALEVNRLRSKELQVLQALRVRRFGVSDECECRCVTGEPGVRVPGAL